MNPASPTAIIEDNLTLAMIAAGYNEGLMSPRNVNLTPEEQQIINAGKMRSDSVDILLQQLVLREDLLFPKHWINYTNQPISDVPRRRKFELQDERLENILTPFEIDNLSGPTPSSYEGAVVGPHLGMGSSVAEWTLENGLVTPAYLWCTQSIGLEFPISTFELILKSLSNAHDTGWNEIDLNRDDNIVDQILPSVQTFTDYYQLLKRYKSPLITELPFEIDDEQYEKLTVPPEAHEAIALYFEELHTVDVASIGQALDLRFGDATEDEVSAISSFRGEVLGTIEDIINNDIEIEKVSRRIQSANNALERVNLAKKSRKFFFAFPFLANHPIANLASVIGTAGTFAYEIYVEQFKYPWAFVSSA